MDNRYHMWMNAYNGTTDTPLTHVYAIGNPLIAQSMLRHDLAAAMFVPPRIVVSELPGGKGTRVIYDDPATTVPVPRTQGGEVHAEMKSAAEGLAAKLEALVQRITKE